MTGIIFVLKSGIPSQMLPQEMGCGSGMTCWRRLRDWQKAGVWDTVKQLLLDHLREADKLDFSRAAAGQTPRGAVAIAEAPPKVTLTMDGDDAWAYAVLQRAVTIRHASGHRIVALVEMASPGNKDRERSVSDFVDKAVAALKHGYHLLLIDLLPPGSFDADGLHGAVWSDLYAQRYEPPPEKPLCLASYVANSLPRAYVEPIAVGTDLPQMPLFLDPDFYVNVPLEPDYTTAYRGVPEYWRRVVEGGG